MKLTLEFDQINYYNGCPTVSVCVNDVEYFNGNVIDTVHLDIPDSDFNVLVIRHYGKTDADTLVVDNVITADKNFTLDAIIIDGYNIEELKWNSTFTDHYNNVIPGCLFFGPNGVFELTFEQPVLKWMLRTRHAKNQNDPDWEEDYNYYCRAVSLVKELL
jgi:hypothetical protein